LAAAAAPSAALWPTRWPRSLLTGTPPTAVSTLSLHDALPMVPTGGRTNSKNTPNSAMQTANASMTSRQCIQSLRVLLDARAAYRRIGKVVVSARINWAPLNKSRYPLGFGDDARERLGVLVLVPVCLAGQLVEVPGQLGGRAGVHVEAHRR